MQREDVERVKAEALTREDEYGEAWVLASDYAELLDRAERAEAERDAAFAAGQEERRVALVYDEAGNVEVYADKGVTIISVCDHAPEDRLYRLAPAPIPDGLLDGYIGHAGDETRADRLATAAAEAVADGVDVMADPGAVFNKVRSN